MTKKTARGDWSDESSTDSASETAAYHEESTVPGKIQSTILSPESPPEYEKGLTNLDYVPKSPVYYPAGYSDDDSDKDSLIDLNEENWDEDHSGQQVKRFQLHHEEETTMEGPSAEEKVKQSPSPPPQTYQARRQNRKHLPGFRRRTHQETDQDSRCSKPPSESSG